MGVLNLSMIMCYIVSLSIEMNIPVAFVLLGLDKNGCKQFSSTGLSWKRAWIRRDRVCTRTYHTPFRDMSLSVLQSYW